MLILTRIAFNSVPGMCNQYSLDKVQFFQRICDFCNENNKNVLLCVLYKIAPNIKDAKIENLSDRRFIRAYSL